VSKAKQKGTTWETAVVDYLNSAGVGCMRRPLSGSLDKSDIIIFSDPTVAVECKDHKAITLSTFVDELKAEMSNLGSRLGFCVVKRARKPVSEAYVVLPLSVFVDQVLLKGNNVTK
jgi:hypothetical protein